MSPAYPIIPDLHHFQELPVTRHLRRELHEDKIVTWWFDEQHTPRPPAKPWTERIWVVSLSDGKFVVDIGHLPTAEDGSPRPTKEAVEEIIARMRNLISKVEARRRLAQHHATQKRNLEEMLERHRAIYAKTYDFIKKRHGELQADKFAHKAKDQVCHPWPLEPATKGLA